MRNKWIETLLPYLFLGISIAFLVGFLIILSYVFFWGLLIGGIIFLAMAIKEKFFPSASKEITKKKEKGRVIEHDDH